MPEFGEGTGELFLGQRSFGRVRFVLYYPPRDRISSSPLRGSSRTFEKMADPPSGRVEPVNGTDLSRVPVDEDLTLRFNGYAMACVLESSDGDLRGTGGWAKVGA